VRGHTSFLVVFVVYFRQKPMEKDWDIPTPDEAYLKEM
jgi:hypothetical protein